MQRCGVIRASSIKQFLDCRVKWYFEDVLRYTTRGTSDALLFGTAVHSALEAYYKGDNPFEAFEKDKPKEIYDEYEDLWNDVGPRMLDHYTMWAPRNDNFKVLSLEDRFEVTLDSVPVCGIIDMVAREPTGAKVIFEHKTTSTMPETKGLMNDYQAKMYLWATGYEYLTYNFLRKKAPRTPDILKSGSTSKNKNIDTTHDVFLQALINRGEDPSEYQDILDSLYAKGNTFFQRTKVGLSKEGRKAFESHLRVIIRDMLYGEIYPNPGGLGWKCRRCAFRDPCELFCTGKDPKYLLDAEYDKYERED